MDPTLLIDCCRCLLARVDAGLHRYFSQGKSSCAGFPSSLPSFLQLSTSGYETSEYEYSREPKVELQEELIPDVCLFGDVIDGSKYIMTSALLEDGKDIRLYPLVQRIYEDSRP